MIENHLSRVFQAPGRIIGRLLAPLALVLVLLFAAGHAALAQFNGPSLSGAATVNQPVTLTTDPAILYPQSREIRLAPGDVISVRVYGAQDYTPQATVTLDGSVQLPLIGVIQVQGLTLHEAEVLIANELVRDGMYRNPQLSLQLVESPNQVATLSGEVRGIIPLRGSKRLLDVLSAAGGFTPTASHIVTIHRIGLDQPIVVDLGTDPAASEHANIPIFAGDLILTGKIGVVYMLGAFRNQGAIPMPSTTPLTLMEAAALSGGPGFEGKFDDLRLIRTIGLERKIVHLDIKRVLNGDDPDPVLQANDILMLPTSKMKAAIKSGGLGTLLGFTSILVVALQR